jgi:hypothetical protein
VGRLSHAELSLHALLGSRAPAPDAEGSPSAERNPECIDALTAGLDTAMNLLASALRSRRPPGKLPPLRQLHTALRNQPTPPDPRLIPITDGLVDATDTLGSILRTKHWSPS